MRAENIFIRQSIYKTITRYKILSNMHLLYKNKASFASVAYIN